MIVKSRGGSYKNETATSYSSDVYDDIGHKVPQYGSSNIITIIIY